MFSCIAFAFSFVATPAKAAGSAKPVPAAFSITGSGWGHGLGMSQYGAYGMALDGNKASDIIEHYYTGAKVALVDTPTKLRVGLLQDKKFVAVRGEKHPDMKSSGKLTLWVDGVKQKTTISANQPIIFETVTSRGDIKTVVTLNGDEIARGSKILVRWSNTSSLINLGFGATEQSALDKLGDSTCALNACSHRYRYGFFEITSGSIGDKDSVVDLNVVNVLRLSDQYLYGLGEMPSSWHIEALKSQVIAARSFALIKSGKIQSYCDCSLDTTDGSQVFSGFSKEYSAFGEKWTQAVNETIGTSGATQANNAKQGQVIQKGSEVLSGFYSSSTGGKTQPRSEVWGSDTISWLVSVDDHWSQDPRVNNPNAHWVDSISQENLVTGLNSINVKLHDVATFEISDSYSSGGIKQLKVLDSVGNVYFVNVGPGKDISPDALRGLLGVKSTYISKIEPVKTSVPGSEDSEVRPLSSITRVNWPTDVVEPLTYKFTGKVSPIQLGATVKLQQFSGKKWRTIAMTKTNVNGAWSIDWKNLNAGNYKVRIVAKNSKGTIKTSTAKIVVSGKLTLKVPAASKKSKKITIHGAVLPATSGVKVTLERKIGNGSWKKVKTLTTDSKGKWSTIRKAPKASARIYYRVKVSHPRLGLLKSGVKILVVR